MTRDEFGGIVVEDPTPQAPAPAPTPVTFYSLGQDVGGPDETQDRWTNKGYSSKGPNLTPGVVAVNDSVHPLGTVFRDRDSGLVFLATDRHGNDDPNVVDVYTPPEGYQRAKVTRNFEIVGRIPEKEIPKTAQGVRDVLGKFGQVPEGPSAQEWLTGKTGGRAQGEDFVSVPELDNPKKPQTLPDPQDEAVAALPRDAEGTEQRDEFGGVIVQEGPEDARDEFGGILLGDETQGGAANAEGNRAQAWWSNWMNSLGRGATSEGFQAGAEGLYRAAGESLRRGPNDGPTTEEALASGPQFAPREPVQPGPNDELSPIARTLLELADESGRLREQVREALPVDEKFAASLTGQVLQGIGQLATVPAYAVPGVGEAMTFGQLYQEAQDDYRQSRDGKPVDEAEAHRAALKYVAGAAPIEALMDRLILGKALKAAQGKLTVKELGKTLALVGTSGGLSEATQQGWLNVVAKELEGYDPERKLDKEVVQSFFVGALVSGLGGTAARAIAPSGEAAGTAAVPPQEEGARAERVDLGRLQGATAQEQFENLQRAAGETVETPGTVKESLTAETTDEFGGTIIADPEQAAGDERFAPPEAPTAEVDEFGGTVIEDPFALDEEDTTAEAEGYVPGGDAEAESEALARRQAEAEYRAEMEAEIAETLRAEREASGAVEIADAVARLGGLPGRGSKAEGPYAGELKMVRQNVKANQRMKLFRQDAPDPDTLVTSLRDMGFDIEGPNQLWDMLDARFRNGVETWSEPARQDDYWSQRQFAEDPATQREALRQMQPYTSAVQSLAGLTGDSLRKAAEQAHKSLRGKFTMGDGRKISITGRGWKEAKMHSADPRVLHVAADLRNLLARSIPLWSEKNTDPKYPNVLAFHNYGTRAVVNGRDSYVRFVIREDTNGEIHYDHDATSVEVFDAKKTGEQTGQPTRNPNPGEDQGSLAKNRLWQWWQSVKSPRAEESPAWNGRVRAARTVFTPEETAARADAAAQAVGTLPVVQVSQELARADVDAFAGEEQLVGLAWRRDLLERGRVDFIGQTVRSAQELAQAAQVYRDPRFETLRWLFVRDGKVVDTVGITSRNPRFVAALLPGQSLDDMVGIAKRAGADAVWLLHNHPSGNPTPSGPDVTLTGTIARAARAAGVEFGGHVVIDGRQYGVVTPDGRWEIRPMADRDELLMPEIDHALLNLPMRTKAEVQSAAETWAQVARDQKTGEGQVTLFLLDTKRKVRAVTTVPMDLFTDRARLPKYLQSRGSLYGVAFAVAYYDNQTGRELVADAMAEYVRGSVLEDGLLTPYVPTRWDGTPANDNMYFGEPIENFRQALEAREEAGEGRLADLAVKDGPVRVVSKDGKSVYATVPLRGLPDIKIIEMPEMLRFARELMGSDPTLRRMRSALGVFVGGGNGQIRLDPRIFGDSTVAAKVLAHEIGHLVDYLPDHELKRGNLIGRLYTLKKHLSATAFGSLTGVKNSDIKAELVELTKWWKPWDEATSPEWYNDYRRSSVELYADALSVLLNSPAELKARAPRFYKEFFAWLDKKAEVKRAFFELQAFLHKPYMEVLRARSGRVREMFGKAEEIYLRHRERRRQQKLTARGFVDALKDELYDRFNPVIRRQEAIERDGVKVDPDLDMRKLFDEHPLADNLVYTWLGRVFERVVKPLEAEDITLDDMGEYLFFSRVMADRSGMANPQGHTEATARAGLLRMRLDLGQRKFTLLERAAAQFHDYVFDTVQDAAKAGLISQETFQTVIVPNRGTYAAFRPIDHVEDYVPAGVFQQVGTLKEIENPWLTTILKTVAMRRAIQYHRAKVGAVEFLTEYFPGEIKPAETRFDGKRNVPVKPKDEARGVIEIRRDGKWVAHEVPADVARMFERDNPAQTSAVVRALNFVFKSGFYNLWVRFNPVFQLAYSPIRDAQRYYVNMPKAGAMKLAANYLKALPVALDRVRSRENPMLTEMYETFALATPHDSFARDLTRRGDPFEEILRQFHILPQEEQGSWRNNIVVKPILKVLRGIEFAGQIFEAAPKIGAYRILTRELGYAPSDAAVYLRNYIGVPNYLRKGRHAFAAGSFIPFWNVAVQGLASDGALMTNRGQKHGKSAASWWFRWALAGGLYAIVSALARVGLLGEEAEELFGGVSEYDQTNYMVIPLGTVTGGDYGKKVVYLRIPQDEMHRVTSGFFKKAIELTVKHAQDRAVRPAFNDLVQLGSYAGGQLPGVNPALGIAAKWADYANGNNPYDAFRGRHVLSNNEWLAGGWASVKPMLGMTINDVGLGNFYRYNPEADTTLELTLSNLPILQRLVKVSDRGYAEQQRATIARGQAADARVKMALGRVSGELAQEFNYLRTLSRQRTPEQEARYGQLREWNRRIYTPTMEAAEAQRDAGVDYKPTLQGLEMASEPWK